MKRSGLKALVVEDEDQVRLLLSRYLERAGIKDKDLAPNEETALKLIQDKNFDLIVSDTMYGSIDPYGPRIVKKAKGLGQNPVVIAISGHPKYLEKWNEVKPNYTLVKPVSLAEFIDIIKKEFPEE